MQVDAVYSELDRPRSGKPKYFYKGCHFRAEYQPFIAVGVDLDYR